jgi:hypothetical protein
VLLRTVLGSPTTRLHPIPRLFARRDLWIGALGRLGSALPTTGGSLIALLSDRFGKASLLRFMNTCLKEAYGLSRHEPPTGLTEKSCRRGGASTAHRSRADRLLTCRCADWDPAGTTVKDSYFDPALVVDSAAAANRFLELARSSALVLKLVAVIPRSFHGVILEHYRRPTVKS